MPILFVSTVGDTTADRPAAMALAAACAGVHAERGDEPGRHGLLAAPAAREAARRLSAAGFRAVVRGGVCRVALGESPTWPDELERLVAISGRPVVARLGPGDCRTAIDHLAPRTPAAVVLAADLPKHRALTGIAAGDLARSGVKVCVLGSEPGPVATRRALAGLDPGGVLGSRLRRLARGAGIEVAAAAADDPGRRRSRGRRARSSDGQAMPLIAGAIAVIIGIAAIAAAFGGSISAAGRVQRAADLAAVSAARSLHDDRPRLYTAGLGGLGIAEYLERARAAARLAAERNSVSPSLIRVSFPGPAGSDPARVRVAIRAEGEVPALSGDRQIPVIAVAEAELVPSTAASSPAGEPAFASGGGYGGPLAYRQGKPMRPDVAEAFDAMSAAALAAGVSLTVNSAFRSDAEQAVLFAAHPDPKWVAPPGTSLHRCATELDLGASDGHAWLASNASGFGFTQRYDWEPWHLGYVAGPDPCSAEGDQIGTGADGDGVGSARGLPDYVPPRFRAAIAAAASRWNVPAGLLAAQLMAESGFDPGAVSPAGAAGIAQFMPATAAAYGLGDPFDAAAAINAQAHLMSDLLRQFGSTEFALAAYNAGPGAVEACGCANPYPETQAYVTRILGLMAGAGEVPPPELEVRLVA